MRLNYLSVLGLDWFRCCPYLHERNSHFGKVKPCAVSFKEYFTLDLTNVLFLPLEI